jgi:4a-hydroxytetrahydrobiopterin dehydratase
MWKDTKDGLYQHFTFADFKQAFEFMGRVAEVAEGVRHHPRWTNEYNVVEIWLSTHEKGGSITKKDRDLAAAIDSIASEFIT